MEHNPRISPGERVQYLLRASRQEDCGFIREMFYEAIYIPPGKVKPPFKVIDSRELARYTEGWMKSSDTGVIAEVDGIPAGAAWTRLFSSECRGYGFISEEIPELSLAVRTHFQGKGIGTAMIEHMFNELRNKGYHHVSLSSDSQNRSVSLYSRMGFTIVRENSIDVIMVRRL